MTPTPTPTPTPLQIKIRKTLAALLLLVPLVGVAHLLVAIGTQDALDPYLLGWPAALVALDGLALYGVIMGRIWGRWLALGGALGGLMFTASAISILDAHPSTLLVMAYFGALMLCLIGRGMACHFEGRPGACSPFAELAVPSRLISSGVILALAGAPVMVLYALVPCCGCGSWSHMAAMGAAGSIAAGVLLLLFRRTAGALLLLAGSLAAVLLVCGLVVALLLHSSGPLSSPFWSIEYLFFAVNLLPAAAGGLFVLLAIGRPAWRLLRGR